MTSSQFKGCKAAHLEAVFTVSAAGLTCDTSCGLAAGSLGLGIKFPGCLGHCQGGGRGSPGSDLFRDLQTFSKSAGWRSAVSSATLEILCGTERETAGPGRRAALPGPGPWRYDVGGPRSVDTGGGGLVGWGGGQRGHPPHLGGDVGGGGGGDHGLHGDAISGPPRTAAVAVC